MANTFQTTQYVVNAVMVRFVNYLMLCKTANRNLQEDFKNLKFSTGQTINYRLEERYLNGEGATAVAEDRVQQIRPLTIEKQFHSLVDYNGFDLTFDRAKEDPYYDMWFNPAAKRLANQVENYVGSKLKLEVANAVGLPSTALSFANISDCRAKMSLLGIPDEDRYCAVNPTDNASLSQALSTVFNNTVNDGALLSGFIGRLSSFDFFETNFLGLHTAGSGGGGAAVAGKIACGAIAAPLTDGASTITLPAAALPVATAGVFLEGDVIELESAGGVGYFSINPLTYSSTNQNMQWVVTADVTSDGAGGAVIPVSPTISLSGARQNVIAVGAVGTEALSLYDSHNVNIAYHPQAIVFAAPAIAELRGGVEAKTAYSDKYRMSMTYSQGSNLVNYQQLDRLDVLAGATINPEFAVRIMSLP